MKTSSLLFMSPNRIANRVKFLSLLSVLLAIVGCATSSDTGIEGGARQETYDTGNRPTESLPTHFFENLEAGIPQTLVVYGTSLSATSEWPRALKAYLDHTYPELVTFHNAARSGKQSNWGVENLEDRVTSLRPDLVFLEFAANDSATKHSISLEKSEANLDWMVRTLKDQNPNVEIILQTMNPAWDAAEHPDQKFYETSRPNLKEYNDIYRDYAMDHGLGLGLVDHYPVWERLKQQDLKLFHAWLPDGLHPIPEASLAVTWKAVHAFLEKSRKAVFLGKNRASETNSETKLHLPTLLDVHYGPHERQVLDFYKAKNTV